MARLNEPPVAPAVPAAVLAGGVGGVESVDARKSMPIQCPSFTTRSDSCLRRASQSRLSPCARNRVLHPNPGRTYLLTTTKLSAASSGRTASLRKTIRPSRCASGAWRSKSADCCRRTWSCERNCYARGIPSMMRGGRARLRACAGSKRR